MLWLAFSVISIVGAITGLLRTQATRTRIRAYLWRATGVSEFVIAALEDYICSVFTILLFATILMFIFLGLDVPTVATVILFLLGIVLLIITLPFKGAAEAISLALAEMEEEIKKIERPDLKVDEIKKAAGFETLREILDRIEQALQRWFSPEVVIKLSGQILALPVKTAYRTIKRIADLVNRLFGIVLLTVLWVMIIGFGLLYVPTDIEGDIPVGLVTAVLVGLALIVVISAYISKVTDAPYRYARFWIGAAVICSLVSMALLPIQVMFPEHNEAIRTQFRSWREHNAKQRYGQRYDQNIVQVVEPGVGFLRNGLFGFSGEITLPLGEVLWQTKEKTKKGPDGIVIYAYYYRQSFSGLISDARRGVWYPKSGTTSLSLVMRNMVLPIGTHFRDDEQTVPDSALHSLRRRLTADVSPVVKHYNGEPQQLCRIVDRDQIFWIWIPTQEIPSSAPAAPRAVMTSAMTVPTGVIVPVNPYPITLATGDKYYQDLRTRPNLSCWIPLPHDLSSQEVVAKWTNPADGKTYLRVRGPQWFNPSVIVHIWVDE